MSRVAALFVATEGVYFGLPDVDPWDVDSDARTYAGPWPVVAHPPCARWGRFWFGGPSAAVRRQKGDDGGCFAAALEAIRRWGGILEHPADSHAWRAFGLPPPLPSGWCADVLGGWCCRVEQGHYGHRARKATWLYVHGVTQPPPPLRWGPSSGKLRFAGDNFHTRAERLAAKARGQVRRERIAAAELEATPIPFRDLLLDIARSCSRRGN